jgi:hypothetical protein
VLNPVISATTDMFACTHLLQLFEQLYCLRPPPVAELSLQICQEQQLVQAVPIRHQARPLHQSLLEAAVDAGCVLQLCKLL